MEKKLSSSKSITWPKWTITSLDGKKIFKLFTCTAICKMTASTLFYPHEVVRTRLREETSKKRYRYLFFIWNWLERNLSGDFFKRLGKFIKKKVSPVGILGCACIYFDKFQILQLCFASSRARFFCTKNTFYESWMH